MSGTKNSSVSCNKIAVRQADTNQVGKHFFQSKKEVKENDVTEMLQKMEPSIQELLYEAYEGTDVKRICSRISNSS